MKSCRTKGSTVSILKASRRKLWGHGHKVVDSSFFFLRVSCCPESSQDNDSHWYKHQVCLCGHSLFPSWWFQWDTSDHPSYRPEALQSHPIEKQEVNSYLLFVWLGLCWLLHTHPLLTPSMTNPRLNPNTKAFNFIWHSWIVGEMLARTKRGILSFKLIQWPRVTYTAVCVEELFKWKGCGLNACPPFSSFPTIFGLYYSIFCTFQ